jgi:nucleotide-binding universal stress UspA family protein
MQPYRSLMVALARSGDDAGLIRYASGIARRAPAARLRFVHVLPAPAGTQAVEPRERVVEELRAEIAAHAGDLPEGVEVSFGVLSGPLTDALLACAAESHADLLVVGHRIEPPSRKPLARRLAMKAPCSVWMVPQDATAAPSRILVPVDFSDHAADSLAVAASLVSGEAEAECLALHVYFNQAVATYEEYDQVLRGEEAAAYRRFVAPIDCKGVRITPLFEESANVPHAIQRVAERERVDLIVMATRGRSRSSSILLGSVAEQVILGSRVPILAVKHFGARLGVLQALLDRRFREQGQFRTD